MAAERIIGVDFGTSTSVIRVKRYKDGKPAEDRLFTKAVTFDSGSTMLPTLIRKIENGAYYGHDARSDKKNSTLFQNFKVDLESPDPDKRAQARELTQEFFQYMAESYQEQSAGGHLGEADDVQKTLISYPVKWSEETKDFMVEAAKKAGFPRVEGMDEAQAAIHAAIIQNGDALSKKNYLLNGKSVNIMLIDMGAGTTDIVICRYTPGEKAKTEVLCTWPREGNVFFGGREVDQLLMDYMGSLLPAEVATLVLKRCGRDKFKAWKDHTLSPALTRRETVTEFYDFDFVAGLVCDEVPEYAIDRATLEEYAKAYLQKLPKLVQGSLEDANLQGKNIDLVILAGGHSQWYFVKEILTGKLSACGSCELSKIQADAGRVIQISLPQETVALGLTYSKLMQVFVRPPVPGGPEIDGKPTISALLVEDVRYGSTQNRTRVTGRVQSNIIQEGETLVWVKDGKVHKAAVTNIIKDGAPYNAARKNEDVTLVIQDFTDTIPSGCMLYKAVKSNQGINNLDFTIVGGMRTTACVWKNGRICVTGYNGSGQCNVAFFRDIVSVALGEHHTVGLKRDGTVVATGRNTDGRCNVSSWTNITSVASRSNFTIGLRENGTVVATGNNTNGQCNVSSWNNIIAIASGNDHSVGLKEDGTVVAAGANQSSQCVVFSWSGITAIAAGSQHTVGLKKDGTVIAIGKNSDGQCNVSSWSNIVAIAAGSFHTVGLKKDGTVVATGDNANNACNVSHWSDIAAIAAGWAYTIGVKKDGKILMGNNEYTTTTLGSLGKELEIIPSKILDTRHTNPGSNVPSSGHTSTSSGGNSTPSRPTSSGGSTSPSNNSGCCYVATAVYGSYNCPEVWTLRRFRDNVLATTWYGRTFIRIYYAISPTIVKLFGEKKWFNRMWRGKLDRLVQNLRNNGVESAPYADKNINELLYGKNSRKQ